MVACGGGTPCFGDNLLLMRQAGRVVYLQATITWLEQNILKSKQRRPLLETESLHQRLDLLLQEREQFYAHTDDVLPAEIATLADFAAIFRQAEF